MTGFWLKYDACVMCGALAGQPCHVVRGAPGRVSRVTSMVRQRPHPGRLHLPGQGR